MAPTREEDSTASSVSNHSAPILVAVDFSEDSEAALIWAGNYADEIGAKLLVLHVVDTSDGYHRTDENVLEPMENIAADLMAEFLDRVSKDHPDIAALQNMRSALVKGLPVTRILEFAEAHKARSIVMGSRGRSGLPHLLLGSKAERVVQLSPLPVTIVKAAAPDA